MYAKYSEIVLHIWLFDTVSLRTFSYWLDFKTNLIFLTDFICVNRLQETVNSKKNVFPRLN